METTALNCLIFEKKFAFLCTHFGVRRTDGQHRRVQPPSLSRAAP